MSSRPPVAPNTADQERVPGLALVRLFSWVVPSSRRADWIAEWAGELHHAWREHERRREAAVVLNARLTLRSLGALTDALWLRRHHGATDMLGLDLKYAVRTLRRRPGFATVVVLTLALGIGATTAIFSVVNGVLLRPLPFPESDRLVQISGYAMNGDTEKVGAATSYPDFVDIRAQAASFDGMAAVRTYPATLTGTAAEPARVDVTYATGDFWRLAGARAVLGRALQPADARPEAPAVAMLGYALWRTRFGGSPRVVGQTVTLDGLPVTIVGVMSSTLRLTEETQLWRPLVPREIDLARGAHRLSVVGRLKAGVSLSRAQDEVRTIARRLELAYPQDNADRSARVEPLRDAMVGDTRPALLVLLGAVLLVLLVGCANLASLFLARAAAREREMTVRAALGAGRAQLVRQWVTESLLLSLLGGLVGLGVAWAGMRALLAWVPRTVPRAEEVTLDMTVLLFLLGVSVATGLLFGVLPALLPGRSEASLASLRNAARGATAGLARRRLLHGIVTAEVALATVLVIGAALLLDGFWRLRAADPRFEPDGVLVAQIQLPEARYDSAAKVVQFYGRLREALTTVPGVRHVTLAFEHPLSEGWTSSFTLEGRPAPPPGREPEARVRPVWPDYFRTVGVRLLAGRDVSPRDRMGTPGVVVVNEAFVRRHFPSESPIGRRILREPWWPGAPSSFEIVGVVADEPFQGLSAGADPATYFAHAQFPMSDMWVIARTDGDPLALAPALRERVWRLDANLPVEQVQTMRELLGASVATPRFNAALLALFAGAALLLATVGIYGVLSYTVAQRSGEIGVRLALGAEQARVLRQVVVEGLRVALLGIGLGVVGALGLARVTAWLVGTAGARDSWIMGGVAALLTLVAIAAAYLPARRASRIDPALALRAE